MATPPQAGSPVASVQAKVEEEGGAGLHQTGSMSQAPAEGQVTRASNSTQANEASVEEIPPPLIAPQRSPVAVKEQVVFHLETTGLGLDSHILRITALGPNRSFRRYVRPESPIDEEASEVNGLTFDGQNLLLNGQVVPCVTIGQALEEFVEFLGDQPVTLFAHNAEGFHAAVLLNAVEACRILSEFETRVTGFVDTLGLFKEIWPGLNYSQPALYKHVFKSSYTAHKDMNDVEALKKLLERTMSTTQEPLDRSMSAMDPFRRHSFSIKYLRQKLSFKLKEKTMLESWQPMVAARSVSKSMAEKAAASGLGVCHLRLALQRQGEKGVHDVLSQTGSDGKPRVTKRKKKLENISSYIALHPTEDKRDHDDDDDDNERLDEGCGRRRPGDDYNDENDEMRAAHSKVRRTEKEDRN